MTNTITLEDQTKASLDQMHNLVAEKGWMAWAECYAPKHLNHGSESTREKTKLVLEDIFNTFPDIKLEPIEVFIQGEWVIERNWFTGTHLGMAKHPYIYYGLLTGKPATGKTMKVEHVHFYRIQNGLIVEHNLTRDDVGMVRQLGFVIELK